MNLLSIQSHVAYGHVGNAAAVFPLQRIGVEVWPIHTVQFSNHTGYGDWQGQVFDAGLIREVVAGIEQRGVLGECDGVLSGYMGGADIGAAILDAVAAVKRANPSARYCCDPVIGDVGRGIFVRAGIPEFMKAKAVPAADIITPNQFELDYLSGRESKTLAEARDAVKAVHDLGPRAVLVTSLHTEETPEDAIDLLASDATGRFRLRTPKLPLAVNGAGDAIAALFFAHYLRSGNIGRSAGPGGLQHLRRARENGRGRRARNPAGRRAGRDRQSQPDVRSGRDPRMNNDLSVYHVDRLDLRFTPKRWPFADERRADIDAWFAAQQREKPALWNGRVLLLHTHAIADGVFRGSYLETDYASFAAWRHWGRPEAAVHDCFGAAAIVAADGAFLLGVMGPHTANAGRIYFPCGTPDPDDIVGGRVDLDFSVRRELKEETGFDIAEFTAEPGWTTVFDLPLIAHMKVLRHRERAEALRAHARPSGARAAAGTRRHPDRARPGRFRSRDAALRHRVPGAAVRRAIDFCP